MKPFLLLTLGLLATGCAKKDPAEIYREAVKCYEPLQGYLAFARENAHLERYRESLKKVTTEIDRFESDAPAWMQMKPGDAYRQGDLMIRFKALEVGVSGTHEDVAQKYMSDAVSCADKF